MPGLPQRDVDTSSWGAKEWRRDRLWGVGFLVIWMAFWISPVVEGFQQKNWFQLWFVLVIAGVGFISVVIDLIRTTIKLYRLDSQATREKRDTTIE